MVCAVRLALVGGSRGSSSSPASVKGTSCQNLGRTSLTHAVRRRALSLDEIQRFLGQGMVMWG